MNKQTKRILAWILSTVMAMQTVPSTAFASEEAIDLMPVSENTEQENEALWDAAEFEEETQEAEAFWDTIEFEEAAQEAELFLGSDGFEETAQEDEASWLADGFGEEAQEAEASLAADGFGEEVQEAEASLVADAFGEEAQEAEASLTADGFGEDAQEDEASRNCIEGQEEMLTDTEKESSSEDMTEAVFSEMPLETELEMELEDETETETESVLDSSDFEPGVSSSGMTDDPENNNIWMDSLDGADDQNVPTDEEIVLTGSDGEYSVQVTVPSDALQESADNYELAVETVDATQNHIDSIEAQLSEELPNGIQKKAHVSDVTILDIKIVEADNSDNEVQPEGGAAVEVSITNENEPEEQLLDDVAHFGDNGDLKEMLAADENVFETTSFSEFAVKYTVDFSYEGFTYSIFGNGQITLSELADLLGIPGTVESEDGVYASGADFAAHVSNVIIRLVQQNDSQVNPEEFYAVLEGDEWVLKSDSAFGNLYEMEIEMSDGTKVIVNVADEQESTDLENFLTNVVITGATQDADGRYVVTAGQEYKLIASFAENSSYQFNNHAELTYQMPEGIKVLKRQSGPLTINIVYKGNTYQVDASYDLTTDGLLTVKFDETDPDFHKLESSTNVSFRFSYEASFDNTQTEIKFSDEIERDIIFDEPEPAQAYVSKSAKYDEQTGKFNYTITVNATGEVYDVNVKDVITGNALIFNNDVQVSGNSSSYTDNGAENGFDYTFASMQESETITITYSANTDFSKDTDRDGKITVDQTKNTVTVKPEGGDPHTSEYSREIRFKSTVKSDGTEAETTADGNKIIDWTIDYNPLSLVSVAGDTITDTIASDSTEYMKYYGSGITVEVRDHSGNLVETRNVSYEILPVHSDSSWTYTIPSSDTTPYSYKIKYQTIVDMEKVNQTGATVNLSNGANGDWGGIGITPASVIGVEKNVESFTTEEVNWISTIDVPEKGLTQAIVTDTLPRVWIDRNHYDAFKDGTLEITGLLNGESYSYEVSDSSVKITFYKDTAQNESGLQGAPGGHQIKIKLTTLVDQDWLQKGYDEGGYYQNHTNTIELNGKSDTATVIFGKPGIEKKGEDAKNGLLKYTVVLKGVSGVPVSVKDTFDTSLLEVAQSDAWDHMKIWGGHQYSQDAGRTDISYTDVADGIILNANSVPMQEDGSYYPYYRICYYLKLKDGVDLQALAIANGGEYNLDNTAVWGDHESTFTYETKYEYLDKKLLNSGELGGTNRNAKYQITFNPAKATLNKGEPMTMTDTLSANLSIDYSSIQIETDPAGAAVPYSLKGNQEGETIATYMIPDSTKVSITYDALVIGDGSQTIVNKVRVKDENKTITDIKDYGAVGEGEGAIASFKIVKVDGNDANKKLEGVKFKIFAEDPNLHFDNEGTVTELELVTDKNGEIILDGDEYRFYFEKTYHIREMEPPADYGSIGFDYLVTLTKDMAQVDYGHYVYYFSDTMQIKNWPLEGLVVEKQVESDEEYDHERYYHFRASILEENGEVNEEYNETNDDYEFINGVAVFELKAGEQKMFWGFEKGTKYKVEEIFEDEDGNEFTTQVIYNVFDEEGNITDIITDERTYHSGELTQDNEVIVFKNSKEEKKGSLTITKTTNGNAGNKTKKFNFTVTLTNQTGLNGTYGDITFTNGIGTIQLANGESATVDNLPVGTTYTVVETEADADGYVTSVTSNGTVVADDIATGTIDDTKVCMAAFENTKDTFGDIELKKTVSGEEPDEDKEFTFTVTIKKNGATDTSFAGTYGDATFTAGVATLTVKASDDAPKKIRNLPNGTVYEIVENDYSADGYAQGKVTGNLSGTIVGGIGTNSKVEITVDNVRSAGSLKITKTTNGNAGDKTKKFNFTVTLTNQTGLNGTYGDITFTNGIGTIQLANGESATVDNLPVGTTYTVVETEADQAGYVTSVTSNGTVVADDIATGTIDDTKVCMAAFENTKDTFGDIELKKTVSGEEPDEDKEFTFTVTIKKNGATDTNFAGTYGDAAFTAGVAALVLKASDTEPKKIQNLPNGTEYVITEADYSADGYAQGKVTGKLNGTIVGGIGTNSKVEITVDNVRSAGSLKITKTTNGNAGDKTKKFNFTVTLTNQTGLNGTYGDITFTNGIGTIQLANGESATVTNLPVGTTYTVVETGADTDGYVTSVTSNGTVVADDIATGTIDDTKVCTAAFENKKDTFGDIELKKTVSGEEPDEDKEFTFTVTIKKNGATDTNFAGTYGDAAFTAGVATLVLKASDPAAMKITGLPNGTQYVITEADYSADGYTQGKVTGNLSGTIVGGTNSRVRISVDNVRSAGSLKIRKEVTENGLATLSDAAKSKLAGTYTFTIYTNEACTTAYEETAGAAKTVELTIPADGTAVTSEEITNMPVGDYWIQETIPTNGSIPVTNPVKVTVEKGKTGDEAVIASITNNLGTCESEIKAQKTLTGRAWSTDDSFEFTLTPVDSAPAPEKTTVTITKDSVDYTESFGKIVFTEEGEYKYTVSETHKGETINGVSYDAEDKTITIKVKEDGNGGLVADGTPLVQTAGFENTYDADGTGVFEVTKRLTGRTLEAEEFSFTLSAVENAPLKDENGDVIGASLLRAKNDKDGKIAFPVLNFKLADAGKTYIYKIVEDEFDIGGVTRDTENGPDTIYAKVIVGSDNGNGSLTDAKVSYYSDAACTAALEKAEFVNQYSSKGSITFSAEKKVENGALKDSEFSFTLTAVDQDGKVITGEKAYSETVTNDADGKISFTMINYTFETDLDKNADGHAVNTSKYYRIEETVTEKKTGMVYHEEPYIITVTLKDDGKGNINAASDREMKDIVFVNTYIDLHLRKTDISQSKELEGAEIAIYAEDGITLVHKWTSTAAKEGEKGYDFGQYLEPGKSYILKENGAPAGYKIAKEVSFSITADGKVNYDADANKALVYNEKTGSYDLLNEALELKVSKVSADDNSGLAGAVLQVLEGTVEIARWTTTAEPYDISGKLMAGHSYTLHEVSAPQGYVTADDIAFTVTKDGKYLVGGRETDTLVMIDMLEDIGGNIYRKLTISKVDEDGKAVNGATLQILENGSVIDEWKTDGTAHEITKVVKAGGSYVLRESKAPDGYEKAADMKFSVTDDGYILYDSKKITSLTMVDQKIKETEKKNKQSGSGSTISGNGSAGGGSGTKAGGGSSTGGGSGSAYGGGGSVKTGDNTPVLPWMLTGIISLMVIAFLLVFKKKRKMTD